MLPLANRPPKTTSTPLAVSYAIAVAYTGLGMGMDTRCTQFDDGRFEQLPAMQVCVDAQAGLAPHRHAPVELQVSAVTPHAAQAAPAAPHDESERVVHWLFEQHPLGQLVASH